MNGKKSEKTKVIQYILGFMMSFVLLFFILGEIFGPDEDSSEYGKCTVYQGAWERVYADGTREAAQIPGNWEAKRGEIVRAETRLPENQETTWFCIRGSQQDVRIYVGDVLRKEYSTEKTRGFGKTSASAYVFFEIKSEDAGKVLAVETVSDSKYSGMMHEIYTGEKHDIWNYFLRQSGVILLVPITLLILSVITVAVSLMLRILHKKEVAIAYLGMGILLASLLMLTESMVRQFYLPNLSVASNMGFFVTKLLPYPFLVYVDMIQRHRYRKYYMAAAVCVIANFCLSTALHILGIVDFLDSMFLDYGMIMLAIFLGYGSMMIDVWKGKIKEYWEVAVGLLGLTLAAVLEIYLVYHPTSKDGGVALGAGLCFLLAMASLKTGRDMQVIEKEKQRAVVAGEAKAQFLAHMSHEIRTPINTVIGMNEMILRESNEEKILEYAKNIRNSSRLLLGLVNDVLDFSKIEAGRMDITEARYSLSELIKSIVQEFRFKAESENLSVQLDIQETLPECLSGDEIRVRQIIMNLLSNAVKYTMSGTITFTVHGVCTGDTFELQISVTDTGIGIRSEDIDRLFDSFQRLDEWKNRHIQGSGLGLSITKQLLDLMGGTITVQSEYGKGSCFSVRIPQKMVNRTTGKMPTGELTGETVKKEKKRVYAPEARVLAVDDNAMNLAVVKALLKRTGVQLETAPGGNECLELCRQTKYDLILLDHMMPEPDGVETLHLLRREESNPNQEARVIVLTANAIAGVAEQYAKEGFDGYLAKPLLPEELEEMLAKHLPEEKITWLDME